MLFRRLPHHLPMGLARSFRGTTEGLCTGTRQQLGPIPFFTCRSLSTSPSSSPTPNEQRGPKEHQLPASHQTSPLPLHGSASTHQQPANMVIRLFRSYNHSLMTYPVITKAVSASCLVALGDVICQIIFSDPSSAPFSLQRTAQMGCIGLVLVGPSLHIWYGLLNRFIPEQSTRGALTRVALDQTVFTFPSILVFFTCLMLLEGRPDDIVDTIRASFWDTCVANWQIWIPAQTVNFLLVPPMYQVLFSNCVGLLWNVVLSFLAHRHPNPQHPSPPETPAASHSA
jgi:hypothetical protein